MKKENADKKECKNCCHYIQHYVKWKNHFQIIFCGHCTKRKPSGHARKTDKICEFYKERNLKKEKEEQFKSAAKCLSSVAESLHQLTELLKV